MQKGLSRVCRHSGDAVFFDLEFEPDLFASYDRVKVMFPELAGETHRRPSLVEVDKDLEAEEAPEVQCRYAAGDRAEPNVRVEFEVAARLNERVESVGIYVISMRRVVRPVRIRVMRSEQLYPPAGTGDAMQFGNERHTSGTCSTT